MIRPLDRITMLIRVLLVLYLVTWLSGIYVNGYVPMPPISNAATLLANPAVVAHVSFAVLTASLSIVLFALGWAYGLGRFTLYSLLAAVSIAAGAAGGLMFIVGLGDAEPSMTMATGFITAAFLTFLSALSLKSGLQARGVAATAPAEARVDSASPGGEAKEVRRSLLVPFYVELALFYLVFVSGMYINEWVAGAAFMAPPALLHEALGQLVYSPVVIVHATLGVLLLTMAVALTVAVGLGGPRGWLLASGASASLVAYSTVIGALNAIGMAGWEGTIATIMLGAPDNYLVAVVLPMLSAAAFMVALIISMLLTVGLRGRTS